MFARTAPAALLVAGLALLARAAYGQILHRAHDLGWSHDPVTNAALDGRIAQAAAQYRRYAPVPRVAFFDLAYPKGCAELASMHGHAVLVVTAVVQDSTELPPARTYVRGAARDTDLVRVVGVESRVASADVRATFGPFRADVLYLLPVQLSVGAGDVLLDFAAHRQAFRVMHLAGRLPEALTACGVAAAAGQAPPDSVFWSLVHREYPDLWGILVPAH